MNSNMNKNTVFERKRQIREKPNTDFSLTIAI